MIVPSPPQTSSPNSTVNQQQQQNEEPLLTRRKSMTTIIEEDIVDQPPSQRPHSTSSSSSSSSAENIINNNNSDDKKKKPTTNNLVRKSSSFALLASNRIEEERDKIIQEFHHQGSVDIASKSKNIIDSDKTAKKSFRKTAATTSKDDGNNENDNDNDNDDGLDEDEMLERQLERETVKKHVDFIRGRLAPALVCWRSQFTASTEELLRRLAVLHSKLADRQQSMMIISAAHHHQNINKNSRSNHQNHHYRQLNINNNNNNQRVSSKVSTSSFVPGSTQFDEVRFKCLQDNRNVLDFQMFLASLEHSANTTNLPFSSLIPNSFKGAKDESSGVQIQQPKTEEDFLSYEHHKNYSNVAAASAVNTSLNTQQQQQQNSSSSSSIESNPHVIVTAGALFAFEEHLSSLFDPPYDSLCRRAIQELQSAIYYDGVRAVDRSSMLDIVSSFNVGKTRAELLSSRYVQLTWCQMFSFLLSKVKTARTMINFKQATLNGQLSLLDRTVDRWRRATTVRLLREWYDYTRKQVYLRRRYRETFVALSSTATTRRAITRWRHVCRMARDRVEAEADASKAASMGNVFDHNHNSSNTNNSNNNTNASFFGGGGTNYSSQNNTTMQSHAEGMAHATVRALQGQLVVRGSMLDHLSTVVKQLKNKSQAQQEVVDSTLKKQAKVLHQFRSLKNALYPSVPSATTTTMMNQNNNHNNKRRVSTSSQNNNNNNVISTKPYRALTSEEWENQMRMDLELRVWRDQQQQFSTISPMRSTTDERIIPKNNPINIINPAFGAVVSEELEESTLETSVTSHPVTSTRLSPTSQQQQQPPKHLSSSQLSRTLSPASMSTTDPYSPTYHQFSPTTAATQTQINNNNNNNNNNNPGLVPAPIRWPEVLASSPRTCTRASHLLVRVRHLISVLCVFISALQKDVVKITGGTDVDSSTINNNNNNNTTITPSPKNQQQQQGVRITRVTHLEQDQQQKTSSSSAPNNLQNQKFSSFRSVTSTATSDHSSGGAAAAAAAVIHHHHSPRMGLPSITTTASFRMPAKLIANNANTSESNSNYSGDPHSIVATFLQELDLDHNEKVSDEMSFVRALLNAINRIAFAGLYQYPNILNLLPTSSPTTFGGNNNNHSSNNGKNSNFQQQQQQQNQNDIEQNIQMMNAVLMHVSNSGTFTPNNQDSNNNSRKGVGVGGASLLSGDSLNNNNNSNTALEMFPLFLPTSSFAKAVEFDNPQWVAMMKISLHTLFALTPMSIPKLILLSMIEGGGAATTTSSSSPSATTASSGKSKKEETNNNNNSKNMLSSSSSSSSAPHLLTVGALTADHRAKSMKNLKNFRKRALLNNNQQQHQQEEADKQEIANSMMLLSKSQVDDDDEEEQNDNYLDIEDGDSTSAMLNSRENSTKDPISQHHQQQKQQQQINNNENEKNKFGISINRIPALNKQKQQHSLPNPPMPAVSELRKEWERAEHSCKAENQWLMDTCERNYFEKAREIVSDAFDQGQTSQLVSTLYDRLLRCNPRLRHNIPVELLAHKLRIIFGEDSFLLQQQSLNGGFQHHNNDDHVHERDGDNHNNNDNNSVTSPRALEQLRQSFHAAAVSHHDSNGNNNNNNNSIISSVGALAPSGSLTVGPIGSATLMFGGDGKMRYPSSLSSPSALKGQWKAVLQNRKRHFINDAKDLEFVLHSIAKVMLLELPALVDKIESTFDDADLFFIQITSQELRTILLEHERELAHLFLLNATKRRETVNNSNASSHHQHQQQYGSFTGSALGDGDASSPPGSFKFTKEDAIASKKKFAVTSSPKTNKELTLLHNNGNNNNNHNFGNASNNHTTRHHHNNEASVSSSRNNDSPGPSLLLMTRDDFAAFCKPWCDPFLSMGMVHEIFIRTVQRYDEDSRSVTATSQQTHLLMNHELFPFAVAMIAATKNPSPFVPLRVKVQQFMEKQIVPMASSVMLGGGELLLMMRK